MKEFTLTVFTPTFNRANLLKNGYEALCRQTSRDFCWLIIDDGSTDNTKETVDKWIKEDKIPITYIYKENGGLHTGYNKAIELMSTELCVCIDSDDYMPDNAVEIIVNSWKKYNHKHLSGMVGYDQTVDGVIMGGSMVEGDIVHYIQLKSDKKYQADNKIVMRVDLLKSIAPQPSFNGEKNFNPIWMILKIDQLAPFVLLDKPLCIVNYQNDGMAANIIDQYFNSPNSFVELRRLYISLKYTSVGWKIRHHIHLIAESIIAKKSIFSVSPNMFFSLFLYPLGMMLYFYLLIKHRQQYK